MSNTRPPTDDAVVSVWTPADQARLDELIERRERIFGANLERLATLLATVHCDDVRPMAGAMTTVADQLITALTPFATRR